MSSNMSRTRTESAGDSLCPVCHEPSEIHAIGSCDHPICYRCSTRMRVLCGQTYCPICRGELHQIVYLTSKQKYDDVDRRNCIPNRKYKILMEDETVEDAFEALLENCCRECEQRPLFDSFQALQTHMRRTHTLFACDLCVSHLKIFPFERKFYNRKDLATHRRTGDKDNRSYRGHPLCQFCDDRYMDSDELLRHLRKSHYYCHFCDANVGNNEYFNDYPDLKEHFQREHFLCEEDQCGQADARFTNAFATEIDLKAHKAAEHMGNKSKAQSRELRTIDVNFQMAPRRRGRDAARVIIPEDYEEVNGSNRGSRDRPRRRNGDRYESPRNDNLTPPPEVGASTNPHPPVLDDFPTLGNPVPTYVPTILPKQDEVVEDFPSLSSQKQSGSASNISSFVSGSSKSVTTSGSHMKNQKLVNNFSGIASLVTNGGSSRPTGIQSQPASRAPQATTVSKSSWAAPRLASREDFPSLSDKKSTQVKDGPNFVNLGAWTKKQKRANAKSNRREAQSPFNSDDEFPTLGGGATPKQFSWVQKNASRGKLGNNSNATSSHQKSSQFRHFNGSLEDKTGETKSKKKKKQKDKSKESKTSTEDSGISLSSIASEIDAMAVIGQSSTEKDDNKPVLDSCQDTPSNGNTTTSVSSDDHESKSEQGESEKWETVVSKKSLGFQDDFPALGGLPKKTVVKSLATVQPHTGDNKTKNNNSAFTVTSKVLQGDDFPTLSSLHEKKPVSLSADLDKNVGKENRKSIEGAKKPKSLLEDDFPMLQTQLKETGPPPGFKKPEISAAPPGLGAHSSSWRHTPPGINYTPHTSTSSSVGSSTASIPMAVKLKMYTYVSPQEAKKRNTALVSRVRQLLILKDDGFDQFRALSAEFRSGQVNAQMYHKTCQDLFGKEKFLEVLPEMVALLPDILKQYELAEAHKQDILGLCAPLNLSSCPTCCQLLTAEDLPVHLTTHADLSIGIASGGFTAALPVQT